MTNSELTVIANLTNELVQVRKDKDRLIDESIQESKREEKLSTELAEKTAIVEAMKQEREKYCREISSLEAERDSARRKLSALALCVGFLKDYDFKHPRRSLACFRENVKKCIDDNGICLTHDGEAR